MSDGAKSRSRGAKACARICAESSWREAKPAVKSGWTSALRASDIIVFAPAEHDRAVLGERARDLDHRLLRIEHLGEPHRAARFHLVADAVRRALRHAAEDRKSVVSGKSVSLRVDLGGRRNIK